MRRIVTAMANGETGGGSGAADLAVRRQRLRWRARRGMLENDIVLERFLDAHQERLDEEEIAGLERLLEQGDKDLFELIRGHAQLKPGLDDPATQRVLAMLQET